jgi:hypothetical protein
MCIDRGLFPFTAREPAVNGNERIMGGDLANEQIPTDPVVLASFKLMGFQ